MHELVKIIRDYKEGNHRGIFSVCSANQYVIEAAMDRLRNSNMYLLIESTANQVDQFGGYTGMKPMDFKKFIYDLCDKNNFSKDRIILGGDHLGPLTWTNIESKQAMENSRELIRQYVLAGFTKIHIDTSMKIKGDGEVSEFNDDVIANRAAELCRVAEDSYKELLKSDSNAVHPVYIVGSEVPIPGGAQEEEEHIQVTKVSNFESTVESFKKAFAEHGVLDAFEYVVGVVVQPGVEFGTDSIWSYDRETAKDLSTAIKKYDNLVFEAHSTDYQTKKNLRKMVEDGYIILKVGPALTFGFREAAFALNSIEEELLQYHPEYEVSRFKEILDFVMIKKPNQWKKHYVGAADKIKFERKYSLSDRCRYYMPDEDVDFALNKLLDNLSNTQIPLPLLSQYMHSQYVKVRDEELQLDPYELLKDKIGEYIDDYIFAVS